MAYDEGLAEMIRADLADHEGIVEKRMFGGLCFMLNGHMLCGVHKDGGMFRVGKPREVAALAIKGVSEMAFTGRKMGGLVDASDDAMADDDRREHLMTLAKENVRSLPPR
ncbi:TfoX/Sxy family protein [Rhodobacteraceae bacterium]|nr:TfoX/Sxy family protein [Paracoccaceae bacterium]